MAKGWKRKKKGWWTKGWRELWRHLGRKRQRSEGKARRGSSVCRGCEKEKARRCGQGGWNAEEEKEGGGRPSIDRLKKGWIFLPLGGGPALGGRVLDSITTSPPLISANHQETPLPYTFTLSQLLSKIPVRGCFSTFFHLFIFTFPLSGSSTVFLGRCLRLLEVSAGLRVKVFLWSLLGVASWPRNILFFSFGFWVFRTGFGMIVVDVWRFEDWWDFCLRPMIEFFDFVSSLYVIEIDFVNRTLFKEVQVSSNLNHPIPENW